MLPTLLKLQQTKKNLLILLGIFIAVMSIYVMFDILAHNSLSNMLNTLGAPLFALHIGINFILAFITATMLSLTQINLNLNKREPKGSTSIPFLSVIFGFLTFGCTPCVIAFLATIGIAFTPITFGAGNLLWKVILLAIMLVAYGYILSTLHKSSCKMPKPQES